MTVKDATNTVYHTLIMLAESGAIRKTSLDNGVVFLANETCIDNLRNLGIATSAIGETLARELQKEGIYTYGQHPFTFNRESVRAAIENADPNNRTNYLLAGSISVNVQDLPYTEETQREVDNRKMMLR